MKNILSYITLILFSSSIYSQQEISTDKDSLVYRFKTCEEGKKEAKADFENGHYNCFSYGLVIQSNPDFDEFLRIYREEKYRIITRNGGCIISDYKSCYSQKMKSLVHKKFGENIFEQTRKEAEELYKNKMNSN